MIRARIVLASVFAVCSFGCGGKGAPPAASGTSSSNGASAASGASDSSSGASSSASSSTDGGGSGGASAAAPEAIDAALPADVEKTPAFSRRAECPEKGPCAMAKGAVPVPASLASQIDPNAPFFAWEQVLPRKGAMAIAKHVGLDMYIVLIDGEVSVLADDIPGKQKRLWKWNGARVPGLGVTVFAKEPTRAIIVYVANAPNGTMGQAGTVGGMIAWSKRPAEVKSVEIDKQPDLSWGDGAYHVRYAFEDGSASLESLVASKNAPVKEHAHDKEWEILAVLSGDGTLVEKPGGKEDDVKIAAGTFASIAPGVLHSYKPAGTSPLVALQLYCPPGPEQRFKKLAADAKK